jgi:phosphoserine phosphatase RsbU/P
MKGSRFSALLVSLASFSFLLGAAPGLHAQTFNLEAAREPVASLDGLWRFHTGDDPAWASPQFDDSQWPLLRSDKSWSEQGYKDYGGFAWYRFTVEVPEGNRNWSIFLGSMESGCQIFVDGHQIGSFGPIHGFLVYSSIGHSFAISKAASGPHAFHIAIRVWHTPGWAMYVRGGFYGSSYFGDSRLIAEHAAAETAFRWSLLVDEYTYGVVGALVGLIVLVLFFIRREEREYLWFSLLLLANALDIGLMISRRLALIPIPLYDFIDGAAQSAALFAAMAFFSIVLRAPRSRTWWVIAGLLILNPVSVYLYISGMTSVGIASLVGTLLVLPATVWILVILIKRAIERDKDALILLVPTLLWQGFPFIDNILLISWQLGWQRWTEQWAFPLLRKPFVLMPAPAVGTIFIFALLLFLIRRFSLARQEETRLSNEFEAARNVQSLLIPANSPATPGFSVESVYLPASEVGGDFFQVLPDDDGSLLVVTGDVSGKGLQAAMTVSAIVGALRGCSLRAPAEVLRYLNRTLHDQVSGFITCCVALIEADGTVMIASAGHLPPYLNGSPLELAGSLPLGMVEHLECSVKQFSMAESDRLLFLSDGVAEAKDKGGTLLGFERVLELARTSSSAVALAKAAQTFGQEDDITVIAVTRVAVKEPALA